MPFVQAKCTNCGANLEIDNSRDAYICPYCNTPFVVEKAINNYNTYHQNYITNNVNADTVILQNTKDFEIKAGVLISYNGESPDVVIPEGPYAIGSNCFKFMGIRSVIIPEGITEIGYQAFAICKKLKMVKLPNTLIEISDSAFEGCESLETIVLPKTLKIIKSRAFEGCKTLKTVNFPSSLNRIDSYAFNDTALDNTSISSHTQISPDAFENTPYRKRQEVEKKKELERLEEEKRISEENKKRIEEEKILQQTKWFEDGLCPFCGGEYRGALEKKCKLCGKYKGTHPLQSEKSDVFWNRMSKIGIITVGGIIGGVIGLFAAFVGAILLAFISLGGILFDFIGIISSTKYLLIFIGIGALCGMCGFASMIDK